MNIDAAQVRTLYSEPKQPEYIETACDYMIPNPKTVSLVFMEIKLHKKVTREILVLKTQLSNGCVHRVLRFLFESGKITREFIRKYGRGNVYNYSVVKE